MPARNEIYSSITGASDSVRRKYLKELADYTKRDTILYSSAFISYKPNVPGILISVTNQDIQSFMAGMQGLNSDKLDLILHSPGGSLEAAEQIVKYLRNKYSYIRAIVPQNAMSAGTWWKNDKARQSLSRKAINPCHQPAKKEIFGSETENQTKISIEKSMSKAIK